jgi:YhcH/YjgK/YiaL family protein
MILDTFASRERYYALCPRFRVAFDYLLTTDLRALSAGRHTIDGDNIFINVMDVELKQPVDAKLEIHDRYADIQVLVIGEREAFGWMPRAQLQQPIGAFDTAKDIQFYDDTPQTYYEVTPAQFTILFPEDAHAPMVGKGAIRKVIVKVLL